MEFIGTKKGGGRAVEREDQRFEESWPIENHISFLVSKFVKFQY